MWIPSPFNFLFLVPSTSRYLSPQSAWVTLSSFSPEVQGFLEMKAEIFMHPCETGLGALSKAPNIARLSITPQDIPTLY